ncbi:MAG: hypothetical protein AAB466_07905 [Verrucomicrobiota bacterium]
MMNPRQRPLVLAVASLILVWLIAVAGYQISRNSKMTADKVRAYAQSVDLSRLQGEARAKAIRELIRRLNALSPEERRMARLERLWARWFEQMTEDEKGLFIDETMPTGLKQMLTAFEELPVEKRRKALDDALKGLREAQERMRESEPGMTRTAANAPPDLSDELRDKAIKTGLKTFYSESSAQTKAEMAPLLEELQRMMESGRLFRGRR